MDTKKTLVVGASTNNERYSNLAVKKLKANGYPVVALGNKKGDIDNVHIETELLPFKDIHTITLYLNKSRQKDLYSYLLSLKPTRIIFNPGAENNELEKIAKQNNVETLNACTLVLLSTHQY